MSKLISKSICLIFFTFNFVNAQCNWGDITLLDKYSYAIDNNDGSIWDLSKLSKFSSVGDFNKLCSDKYNNFIVAIKKDGTLWKLNNNGEVMKISDEKFKNFSIISNSYLIGLKEDKTLWIWENNLSDDKNNFPIKIGENVLDFFLKSNKRLTNISLNIISINGFVFSGKLITDSKLDDEAINLNYSKNNIIGNNWKNILYNGHQYLGLKNDGTIWVWGDLNPDATIGGVGKQNISETPIIVGLENDWKEIKLNINGVNLALKSNGKVFGWKYANSYTSQFLPIEKIKTPRMIKFNGYCEEIFLGPETIFIKDNKSCIYSMGSNFNKQLGLGHNTDKNEFTIIEIENSKVALLETNKKIELERDIAIKKEIEKDRLLAEQKAKEEQLLAEKKAKEGKLLAEKKVREEQLLAEKKVKAEQLKAESTKVLAYSKKTNREKELEERIKELENEKRSFTNTFKIGDRVCTNGHWITYISGEGYCSVVGEITSVSSDQYNVKILYLTNGCNNEYFAGIYENSNVMKVETGKTYTFYFKDTWRFKCVDFN